MRMPGFTAQVALETADEPFFAVGNQAPTEAPDQGLVVLPMGLLEDACALLFGRRICKILGLDPDS